MTNQTDIFEIMKSGEEVRQDHPQFADFMEIVAGVTDKYVNCKKIIYEEGSFSIVNFYFKW
jgi:riboflavin synthase